MQFMCTYSSITSYWRLLSANLLASVQISMVHMHELQNEKGVTLRKKKHRNIVVAAFMLVICAVLQYCSYRDIPISFYTHLLLIEYIHIYIVWLANICFSVILLNFEHGFKFIWLKYVAMVMQHKQICLSIQNSYHEEWVIACKDTRNNMWHQNVSLNHSLFGVPIVFRFGCVLHLFYFYSLMCFLSYSASAWKGRAGAAFGARAGIPGQ